MCIDILVSEEHAKERKAKLAKERESKIVDSKRVKIDPETGEIDLTYNQTWLPEDYYLVTRREEPKEIIQLEWDYKAYKSKYPFSEQHDWNQTLITRINQIAATIRKQEFTGKGARFIKINPTMLPLLQDLMYFNESDGIIYSLSNRYSINLDSDIPKNEIIVLSELSKGKILIKNYNKKTWIEKVKNFFSFNTK